MIKIVSLLYYFSVKERRKFLRKSFRELSLKYVGQKFEVDGYEGENFIITDFMVKNRPFLAITAHYDGPGAYDNCGGVAVLLWLIKWLKKYGYKKDNVSILPIFTDGEERGLLGVRYLLENFPFKKEIKAHIALDGFGIGSNIAGIANLKEMTLQVGDVIKKIRVQAETTVFQERNIPSLSLFTLPNEEIYLLKEKKIFPPTWRISHTDKDTPENIDEHIIPFVAFTLYKRLASLKFYRKGVMVIRS